MMVQKTIKWSFILGLVGGLSSCMMYDQRNDSAPNPMVYEQQQPMQQNKVVKATKAASTSAKEPVQQSAPGPKRAAAPQLPVIQ
jgi:hypothetical protein